MSLSSFEYAARIEYSIITLRWVNPQSEFQDCQPVRVYYFKVEAGTIQRPNAGDGNTPGRISDSREVRVCCMYGNVRQLGDRPMLVVVNSDRILVSQPKAFAFGS